MKDDDKFISLKELADLNSQAELIKLLDKKNGKAKKIIETVEYEIELEKLQIELIKLQQWVVKNKKRLAILFEGRDAAGKGGAIRRFTEHLVPRSMRVVALPKPTDKEIGQWYFQRYVNQLPNEGEIVFFDRSWYNRAIVEPVNSFCTELEYTQFMRQVPEFEHMLYEDGILIIKFWFAISKKEQKKRFGDRSENPLKQWKMSAIDWKAQELWDDYTKYRDAMLNTTHTQFCPWIIVDTNNKKEARLESIRYVLSTIPYEKDKHSEVLDLTPNPNVIYRYYRRMESVDSNSKSQAR